jgi:hypothetical protein
MRKRLSAGGRPVPLSLQRIRRRYALLRRQAEAGRWPPELLEGVVETMLIEEWANDPAGWAEAQRIAVARAEPVEEVCAACGAPDPEVTAGLGSLCPVCADRGWAEDWDGPPAGA